MSSTPSRPTEKIHVPNPRFVGEQDGPFERTLKDQLVAEFLRGRKVNRAYLARADYGDGKIVVILGLRAEKDMERKLVDAVGAIFAAIFGAEQHLDIFFLTNQIEDQLVKVCNPFFRNP